jgi:hypothetical protein
MISYLNSGHPVRYLAVLLLAIVIWLPSLLSPEFIPQPDALLHQGLTGFAEDYTRYVIWGLFAVTFLLGVMLNQVLKEYDLVNVNNTTGLALFVLFVSAVPLFTSVNIFIIVNIFLMMSLQGMMRLSLVEDPVKDIFNASLYLGIAAVFYPPLLFLFLIVWTAILMNRHMDLRNFLITLVGLLIPFLFLFTWYFWNDTLSGQWKELIRKLTEIQTFNLFNSLTGFDFMIIAFLMAILILAVLKTVFGIGETSITTRRNINLTFYFLIGLAVLVLLYATSPLTLLILAAPSAILVSHALYAIKNKWLNLLFIILLALIIIHQYDYHFDVKSLLFR